MKIKLFFLALYLLLFSSAFAQTSEQYKVLIKEAWKLYETKSYAASGQKYLDAFAANGNKGLNGDRYNAACSWALAGNADAAFDQLFKISREGNYSNYSHLTVDTDLNLLHNDPRWKELTTLVKTNKEKSEASLDKPMVATLDSIYQEDQFYRMQLEPAVQQYGRKSDQVQALYKKMARADSINLVKVLKILDTRGWLGPNVIGEQGNTTLFLVIQHADQKTQEKYLPMFREAVQKGNAKPADLALMEDRVALRQGKRQTYGSQIGMDPETGAFYVSPLDDPDNVDKRRAAMGLQPIADYLMHWNITWDVEAYKKQLPEIEAKRKN